LYFRSICILNKKGDIIDNFSLDEIYGSSTTSNTQLEFTAHVMGDRLVYIHPDKRYCYNRVSEWLLFNANSAIFQLYHGENKLIFNEMMMRSALGTLFRFRANQSLLFLLNATCLAEKQQILILVFGLTWPGLELTVYHIWDEHADHYATDAVATIDHLHISDFDSKIIRFTRVISL
jgi:hypothetical protein